MMPEEWPIAASAADQNAPARRAGRDRLSTVRADFFLDPAERLSEQERALMTAMLHCLIGDIADEAMEHRRHQSPFLLRQSLGRMEEEIFPHGSQPVAARETRGSVLVGCVGSSWPFVG